MSGNILLGALIAAFGTWLVYRAYRSNKAVEKYEFENRTDGGVVQFDTFENAKRHERKGAGADLSVSFGCLTMFIGFAILLFSL